MHHNVFCVQAHSKQAQVKPVWLLNSKNVVAWCCPDGVCFQELLRCNAACTLQRCHRLVRGTPGCSLALLRTWLAGPAIQTMQEMGQVRLETQV